MQTVIKEQCVLKSKSLDVW